MSAVAITTVHYLVERQADNKIARQAVDRVLSLFEIASVDADMVRGAFISHMEDFEDSVQAFAGIAIGAEYVITRDHNGFVGGPLTSLRPEEFVRLFTGKPF